MFNSLLLTHGRQIAGCQAEDVIRKAGGAQGQAGPPDTKRLPRGLIGEFPPLVPLLLLERLPQASTSHVKAFQEWRP